MPSPTGSTISTRPPSTYRAFPKNRRVSPSNAIRARRCSSPRRCPITVWQGGECLPLGYSRIRRRCTGGRFATCKRIIWITICCTLWAATRASRLSTNVLSTAACSTFCCASARPGASATSGGRSTAIRRSSTTCWPCTTAVRRGGISSRSR